VNEGSFNNSWSVEKESVFIDKLSDQEDREQYRSAVADITDEQILNMINEVEGYLFHEGINDISERHKKVLIEIVRSYLIPR